MEPDEAELVARARKGDYEAFETLVTQSEGRVYGHLMRLMGNPDDARDLLQETYLSAFRGLESFKGDSAFSTWIYRIATNHALMRLRRKVPEEVEWDELQIPSHQELKNRNLTDWELDPKEALLRKELRGVLDAAIQALPPAYRAVVTLRDVEDLNTDETARILGISEGAVKTRLHRARIFLREKLSPYFEAEVSSGSRTGT